jgi:hypothetical protein
MSADTLTPTSVQAVVFPQPAGNLGWVLVGPNEVIGVYDRAEPGANLVSLQGLTPDGQSLFNVGIVAGGLMAPVMAATPGAGVLVLETQGSPPGNTGPLGYVAFDLNGVASAGVQSIGPADGVVFAYQASSTPTGYHIEWVTTAGGGPSLWQADLTGTGQVVPGSLVSGPGGGVVPYAAALVGGQTFTVMDNQAQLAGAAPVTVPGEPPHGLTEIVATGLAGVDEAAVAWADSGTAYAAIYDAASNSFGAPIGLDWGGASQLHIVGLPDGDFVVSWLKGGQYEGEVFTPAGVGGGLITLAGQAIGVDGAGDLLTAGFQPPNGILVIQSYAIGQAQPNDTVYTSDPFYIAPTGVSTIHLTGSNQVIQANGAGDIIWSNDTGNDLVGGAGADTFHLGRGGDTAVGGGGSDTFDYAAIPWAGGHITDFSASDVLDLSGLMSTTSDTGSDGFVDGYLKITDDGSGNAQVWADYHIPGNDGWWLVTTLNGVSPSSLQHVGDVISLGSSTGPTDVSTAAATYTAPASVKTIALTGSNQTIDASATNGVTITSNDSGNVLMGGPGDDTFHLGRGGDWVTGGAGADTFAYAAIPWAGGAITDFNAAQGDKVDVTGLLANASFNGPDPFAAGYLKYETDSNGNAQLWADYNLPGNNGWWLVATLDGVSTSSLHYAGGMIT